MSFFANSALPAPADAIWPPHGTTAVDNSGRLVDITGNVWRLASGGEVYTLDWSTINISQVPVLNAVRRYFADLITRQRAQSVYNAFRGLDVVFGTQAFRASMLSGTPIPFLVFSEARAIFGPQQGYRLHYWRMLYQWCSVREMPQFCQAVAQKLADQTIGGNVKGRAVRSADPSQGPLTASEVFEVTNALRASRVDGSLTLAEQAALWLCLTIGANSTQYAPLREEDLIPMTVNGQRVGWLLRVPRHKKRDALDRAQFKARKLHEMPAAVIRDLIEENRQKSPVDSSDLRARPLFRRPTALPKSDPRNQEWAWHLEVQQFRKVVGSAIRKLNVKSYCGEPLHINPRRFRYTLGTRLVASGASKYAVADALDHLSLQNVNNYFDVDAGIVDMLDTALALALAPRAQAFIVAREEDAERGNVKGSRCHFSDRDTNTHDPIGTCGSNSFCNVIGPLACYTCRRFQPWIDGPHETVLSFLIERRESRRAMGLDDKLVGIEDNIIFAVAGVVNRVAEMRTKCAGND